MRARSRAATEHGYTIAEGIAVKQPGELTSAILGELLDEVVTVSDEEISQAIVLLLERDEARGRRRRRRTGRRAARRKIPGDGRGLRAILSGGNIDPTLLIQVMRHGLTASGRYLVVRTRLGDRPGELIKLLQLVAEERANVVSVEHHREGMDVAGRRDRGRADARDARPRSTATTVRSTRCARLPGRTPAVDRRGTVVQDRNRRSRADRCGRSGANPARGFCSGCGALARRGGAGAGGAQGRDRPLRRPRRLHVAGRAARPGGRARAALAVPRAAAVGARALRRDGREVHRRRGDGALRRADRARGRPRAGRAGGARDPRLGRGRADATSRCGSRSTPARRSSRSARGPQRARGWPRATSSTRPRGCSRPRRSTGSSSASRPTARPAARSITGRRSRSRPRARRSRSRSGRRSRSRCRGSASTSRGAHARARRPRARSSTCSSTLSTASRREQAPQLVTLVGVPGIGKSRLVYELVAGRRREPELIAWRQGRSLPYGEGVSFWALARDRQGAGRHPRDATRPTTPTTKLRRGGRDASGEASADWVRAAPSRRSSGSADDGRPGDRGQRRSPPGAASSKGSPRTAPLVLVFEDLHWADDGLLDFVDHLVDWVSGVPLLVVVHRAARAARRARPAWGGGKRNATTLSLVAPLGRGDGRARARAARPRRSCPRKTMQARCSSAPAATRCTRRSSRGCSPSGALVAGAPLPETRAGDHRRRASTRFRPSEKRCCRTRP